MNKKAKSFFGNSNNFISIYNLLEINKLYLTETKEKGCAFSCIEITMKNRTLYADLGPITFNSQIFGILIIFKGNSVDSFVETFKTINALNKEIELFYSMYYDEIMATDSDGNIIIMNNPMSIEYYNLSKNELLNNNVRNLEKENIFKPSVTLKILKAKKNISLVQKTKNGKILMVYGIPVLDKNFNLYRVFSTSKDITEIYQLREKLTKTKKLIEKYQLKIEELKNEQDEFTSIIYRSAQMRLLIDLIKKIATVDSNVILTGESGVGKSLFAKLIHKLGPRKNNELISINCGAIPENLLESEFFGYERGAFTGAKSEGKVGYLELANNGTLFLDEIGELPSTMQVKLLKVIDEKSFMRVGGIKPIKSDFRLIAATNKDLEELVKENKFRKDLFYRINVIQVNIPPLRERKEDIPLLVSFFLDKYNKKYNKTKILDPAVYDVITEYSWPGNIRELENVIERLVVTIEKNIITTGDLPRFLTDISAKNLLTNNHILPLKKAIESLERQYLLDLYKRYKSTYKISEISGISQPSVVRKIKKYQIKI